MHAYRVRSSLSRKALLERLDSIDGVAIRYDAIGSMRELELAWHLTKKAFTEKKAVAKQIRFEFLLWVSGKTDIMSAMKETAVPENGEARDFFVVVFSDATPDAVCRLLDAEKLPLGLEKEGDPLALERVSLSRIKG